MIHTSHWTPTAQARRIAATDLRTLGVDVFIGLFYVIAACFLNTPRANSAEQFIVAPIAAVTAILIYYTIRICFPERADNTAAFYANLPRDRALTCYTHGALLLSFVALSEALILGAMCIGIQTGALDPPHAITASLFALPIIVTTGIMWGYYGPGYWIIRVPAMAALLLGAWIILYYDIDAHERATTELSLFQDYGIFIALLLLSAILLRYSAKGWSATQVGEFV